MGDSWGTCATYSRGAVQCGFLREASATVGAPAKSITVNDQAICTLRGALGADSSARRHIEFCRMRQRRLTVCQRGAAKTSRCLRCLSWIHPSGALHSHAHSYHEVSFSLSSLHFIELCDASFIIDVWQARQRVRHFIGIEDRDKDRVIMLTTKCFHYNARQKWTARAGVKSMRCEMGNEGGKSTRKKKKKTNGHVFNLHVS